MPHKRAIGPWKIQGSIGRELQLEPRGESCNIVQDGATINVSKDQAKALITVLREFLRCKQVGCELKEEHSHCETCGNVLPPKGEQQ